MAPDLDITVDGNLSNNTAPVLADRLLLVRNSDNALMDITFDQLMEALNLLTADTDPDFDLDYLLSYDASASAVKKVLLKRANRLVQRVEATPITTYASITTALPFDDTIPQSGEGAEVITVSITPTNATNRLVIRAQFCGTSNTATATIIALFQDSTADALKTAVVGHTANGLVIINLVYEMAAGTTSATTFKIRAGNNTGATTYVNGNLTSRQFGGNLACTLSVEEIQV